MSEKKNPLLALIEEEPQKADLNRLASFLKPFVSIDKRSRQLTFRSTLRTLNDNNKAIEVVLMASLARALVFEDEPASMPPKDIIVLQILPEGSTKTALRTLFKSGRIKKDAQGYYLPVYRLEELLAEEKDHD